MNGADVSGPDPYDRDARNVESTDATADAADEITDEVELTPAEEQLLQSLMKRAAAGLTVETPQSAQRALDAHMPQVGAERPMRPSSGRSTGKLLGIAAALVVIVAIAGAWLQRGDTDSQIAATASDTAVASESRAESSAAADSSGIDAGKSQGASESAGAEAMSPAAGDVLTDDSGTEFSIDPEALAAGGIWRLPDGSASLEVTGVQASPHESGFQIAVDDVDEPSRWFAVLPTRYWMDAGGQLSPERTHELGNSMQATVLRPDEKSSPTASTWIDLRQKGDPLNALTFVYRGVPDAQALAAVKDVAMSITDLTDASAVRAALVDLRVPDGLNATWDPGRVGYPLAEGDAIDALELKVRDSSSNTKFTINLNYTGLPPAVARLEQLFGLEASLLNAADGSARVKADPYPGLLKLSSEGMELLMAFTQDGVAVNVDRDSNTNEVAPIGEQVRILNALRPISEADFRARMKDLGIEIR
ncbi:MAG: hypothetical protein WBA45_15030 [Microthrixaceae bacterium]